MIVKNNDKIIEELRCSYEHLYSNLVKFAKTVSQYDHKAHVPPDSIKPENVYANAMKAGNANVTQKSSYQAIDAHISQVEEEIERLGKQKEALYNVRFDKLVNDNPVLRYEVYSEDGMPSYTKTRIILDGNGGSKVVYEGRILNREPYPFQYEAIPKHMWNDFITIWRKAKQEQDELEKNIEERLDREREEFTKKVFENYENSKHFWYDDLNYLDKGLQYTSIPDDVKKKFIRQLQQSNHPDNNGDNETFNYVQILKRTWGV